ncbi:MAG: MarR family transcriptional regulator [Deltaproteobacteria bacterium]|nr:MarR family transcriptional regulator [Deltaproteobacteria bacterium]MBW1934944.1 MarR family transcriptional regulator [Deltaproteobacteria bacterium]MBW1977168.1 MarR family transcriptional regulator [Deltaproteobacteria bacterium]MBW2045594.1 MarR family transcriptional regulator [Deltaproteobacteria bacterium]MBW2300264.1 MarR family transcriptional regulator [Deltaproteobacteria bacterium]
MHRKRKINPKEMSSDIYEKRTKEIIFSIRRLIQASELYSKELNKKYSVSAAQLNCLLALYENGPLSPSQIAKHILVNSSTVTGIIDRLEEKDFVERLRVSPDRRIVTIELTRAGKKLAKNAPPPIQQKIINGLRRLSKKEIDQTAFALAKLTNMLDVEDLEVT